MPDVTVKREEDFETTFRGGMLRARAGLGVTAFGMQIIRLPAGTDFYPEHDHAGDGQEEVYVALEGSATLNVGEESWTLEPGTFARVGPRETRKIVTTDSPARVLCLGGIPGAPYEAWSRSETGAPDPAEQLGG